MNDRSNLPNLPDRALTAVLADVLDEYVPSYTEVANITKSDSDQEEYLDTSGIGELTSKSEDASVNYDNILEGYKTIIRNQTYARGMKFSMELLDDNKFDQALNAARANMRSFVRTRDHAFWGMLNSGFNTAKTSYGDGLPLFSTAHLRKDGGSNQSNASATGIPLTEANLETGILALRQILDHKGQPKNIGWEKIQLVVGPALAKTAIEITKSELISSNSNNAINWYRGQNIDVIVVPWLGATLGTAWDGGTAGVDTNWFLLDPITQELTFQNRKDPTMESDMDFDTKQMKHSIVTRFQTGWIHWFGTWGSKGDGAAYSS